MKTLATLLLLVTIQANATTQWFTNSLQGFFEIYDGGYQLYHSYQGEGEADVFVFNLNGGEYLTTSLYIGGGDYIGGGIQMPNDAGTQSYSVQISEETYPNGMTAVPIIIPEPEPFALFMIGFALVFGSGMMATGARWVRQLVVGETETL